MGIKGSNKHLYSSHPIYMIYEGKKNSSLTYRPNKYYLTFYRLYGKCALSQSQDWRHDMTVFH